MTPSGSVPLRRLSTDAVGNTRTFPTRDWDTRTAGTFPLSRSARARDRAGPESTRSSCLSCPAMTCRRVVSCSRLASRAVCVQDNSPAGISLMARPVARPRCHSMADNSRSSPSSSAATPRSTCVNWSRSACIQVSAPELAGRSTSGVVKAEPRNSRSLRACSIEIVEGKLAPRVAISEIFAKIADERRVRVSPC